MSEFDDDEALFDDIYDDDSSKKEEKVDTSDKPQSSSNADDNTGTNDADAAAPPPPPPPPSSAPPAQAPAADPQSIANTMAQFMGGNTDMASAMAALTAMQQQQQQQPQQNQQNNNNNQDASQSFNDSVRANIPPGDLGKMFIGGLNWETTEEKLKTYFSEFGDVLELTIMKDTNTGRSRGFGFLTFASSSSVDAVLKKQHIVDGKLIDPKRAIPREEQDKTGKIFVGGIPPDVTESEFSDFFAKFGNIIDAQLMLDKDTGRSRGYGFVTFDSPEAVDRVTVSKYIDFKGKQVEIKRAEPRGQQVKGRNNMNQGQMANGYYGQMQQGNPMASMMGQYGAAGANQMYNPAQMQQYYQSLQQYWMQMQQQMGGQQQGGFDMSQMMQQQQQPSQIADSDSNDHSNSSSSGNQYDNNGDDDDVPNPQEQSINIPSGPKHGRYGGSGGHNGGNFKGGRGRSGFRGGRGGRGNGRGGSGGYHPYSRN